MKSSVNLVYEFCFSNFLRKRCSAFRSREPVLSFINYLAVRNLRKKLKCKGQQINFEITQKFELILFY